MKAVATSGISGVFGYQWWFVLYARVSVIAPFWFDILFGRYICVPSHMCRAPVNVRCLFQELLVFHRPETNRHFVEKRNDGMHPSLLHVHEIMIHSETSDMLVCI
jgi:hypothetical protein